MSMLLQIQLEPSKTGERRVLQKEPPVTEVAMT